MTNDLTYAETLSVQMLPDGRLDAENAAKYLGLKPKTLAMFRCDGSGPKFIKKGKVFYFKEDLDNWLNGDGRFVSTAQAKFHQGRDSNDDSL